jgi:ankyrin repeat protein
LLLALVVLLSLPLGWVAAKLHENRLERQAAAVIYEKLEGRVFWNWTRDRDDLHPPGPAWLRWFLGDDFFVHVTDGHFYGSAELTDTDLIHVQRLPALESLSLQQTIISDDGLRYLHGLTRLKHLNLLETDVTAGGAAELQRALPQCKIVLYEHSDNDGVGYEQVVMNGVFRDFAPIHEAAKKGDVETIRQELKEGVPVDLRVKRKHYDSPWIDSTPLFWAALRGQVAAVKFLIAEGADVNAENKHGVTPLMAAAGTIETIRGNPCACVVALLEAGANVEAADREGRTAIYYACGTGALVAEYLHFSLPLKHRFADRSDYRARHEEWLMAQARGLKRWRPASALYGDADRVKALVRAGARLDVVAAGGMTPLIAASSSADDERIRLLLEAGADVKQVTRAGRNALWAAAQGGSAEMMRLLLEAGSPLDGALHAAAESPEEGVEKVRMLLKAGADVNGVSGNGETPLVASLWWSSSDAAPVLLAAGANPRVRGRDGETALIMAARHGPADALRLLLKLGLDAEQRSTQDALPTALILAAGSYRDRVEKVKMLLKAGAKLEGKDNRGATALLEASREGYMDAVVALAEAGANVHVTDADGMTPLHFVAQGGQSPQEFDYFPRSGQTGGEAARALLRRGADAAALNLSGETPRTLARLMEHQEVLDVLDAWRRDAAK